MINAADIRFRLLTFGAMILSGFVVTDVRAQSDSPEYERQACLALRAVDRMHAVDDRTILFFMRGREGRVFRNDLPQVCRDLRRNRSISYSTTSSRNPRLCANDLIRVRESGVSCQLGDFRSITTEEAESLLEARNEADDATELEGSDAE